MRLYFFVMYNLSGIQKGIQCGHAALEYALAAKDDPRFLEFMRDHKTWIVLSGGGSEDMKTRIQELHDRRIKFADFMEPDLNNSISAVAFLMEEKDFKHPREFDFGLAPDINRWINSFSLAPN